MIPRKFTRNSAAVLLLFYVGLGFHFLDSAAASSQKPDLNVLKGEWVRRDGHYVIKVLKINPDGSADTGYYNPRPINVAQATASVQKGLQKLFIRLQDRGYPGSTYTLYYYEQKDALAGFYYHAELKQTFEVVFFRKK